MNIAIHPSLSAENLRRGMIAALRDNRLDPKALYATPRQAELWRQVSQRHAPIHRSAEFRRIYEDAFAWAASGLGTTEPLHLIGLGSGTGEKEAHLCRRLLAPDREIFFSAIDVSRDLVEEAAGRLASAGAAGGDHLVCDLNEVDELRKWLDERPVTPRRVITFFGLMPNFPTAAAQRLWRALVRPGDLLLASVHLAPANGVDRAAVARAMEKVLPQYDNPETLTWLDAALEYAKLRPLVHSPRIVIGEVEGTPAFLGEAAWKTAGSLTFVRWGERFHVDPDRPLGIFQSLRYLPETFEVLVHAAGLRAERLAVTACAEEGIWSISHSLAERRALLFAS